VAVGRGRRAAFVARAPRRAGDLPPNLAQQQRAPKDPARALFSRACWRKIPRRARPKKQLLQRRASIQPLLEMLLATYASYIKINGRIYMHSYPHEQLTYFEKNNYNIVKQIIIDYKNNGKH
jgi:hypothetical protein